MSESIINVLLADDHDMFRQGVGALLGSHEHIHIVAQLKSGDAALDYIKAEQPDIAILDISMPGMSGIDVCEALMETPSTTRIIILTMHDDLLLARQALQAGASGFILKDNTFDEMLDAIEAAMSGESFVSAHMADQLEQQDSSKAMPLSSREREVLRLLANGVTVKQISEQLGVSSKSVDTYRQRLLSKLSASNTAELIQYAVKRSLV